MGVHGLWELLAPVGRRVSVETLAGKRLAIDASIWLVQFMKAMRDEKGEMVRNAHLLGFFRRICKLLFLRTKPVFVFDGGTPALKRRTVIARRRQRENAQAKVRKTAEKLLLNHMKAMKLKELADDVKNQRQKQKSNAKGRKNNSDQIDMVGSDSGRSDVISCSYDAQKLDSMSGPNVTAEQDQNLTENACKSPTAVPSDRKDGGEETLVKHIRKQEKNQENGFKCKKILSDQNDLGGCYVDENVGSTSCNQERLDEMLVASIVAEEDGILAKNGVASAAVMPSEDDSDADEEMILTGMNAEVDPAILDALPPSMQLDLLVQHKGKKKEELGKDVENQRRQWLKEDKGKGILLEQVDRVARQSRKDDVISRSYSQEKVDELLAASIAAEEDGRLANNASEFNRAFTSKEEDSNDDGDEEMILPAIHGEVDPAVLASLPPSMQLDLLVQMRERLMAENRQKYQKVKKDPTKFSELQIQAYLKTVSFRREIDEVQKAAAGRGVGGVHSSRIASESNREYIFSSSFTGDKQELTSMRAERNDYNQQQTLGEHPSQDSMNCNAPTNKSNNAKGLVADMSVDESIQTYLDERGHFRVSRLRALGMRMTRDIQRNLDLMKEIEQEKTNVNEIADAVTSFNAKKNGTPRSSYNHQVIGASHEGNVDLVELDEGNEQSVLKNDTSIEISFEDDHKCLGGDDQLFASLVAGNPVTISSNSNPSSKKQLSESDSDCDWEEGNIEGNASFNNVNMEMKSSVAVHDIIDENEVEWEEGVSDSFKNASSCPAQSGKAVSRGLLEEEANFQEAIRRSLEDLGDESTLSEHENPNISSVKYNYALSQDEIRKGSGVKAFDNDVSLLNQENNTGGSIVIGKDSGQQIGSYSEIVDGVEKLDGMGWGNGMQTVDPLRKKSESSVKYLINMGIQVNTPLKTYPGSHSEESSQDANGRMINEVHDGAEQLLDISNEDGNISTDHNSPSTVNPSIPCPVQEYEKNNDDELPSCHATELTVTPLMGSSKEESKKEDIDEKLATVITQGNYCIEKEINNGKDAVDMLGDFLLDTTEVDLEEEMLILGQEFVNLGNEQRKLERNAESVSSELFTECQELLQMFGLPYIIAPMEAEAQCAYMELTGLVDGVVTDDSDVFLFGARSVYKNIFDERKYVETYFMQDVEKELGLTREKLIHTALLLGSDYTEGVSGIGIVNAIEVVNAFPEEDGLLKFREWVESPDPTILGKFDAKTGSSAKKKGLVVDGTMNSLNGNMGDDQNISCTKEQKQSASYIKETKQNFMDKHRNVSKNWHIPSAFPSEAVIAAYTSPQVDKSTDPVTWGKPDRLVLRKLCWEKFGWTGQKADELLLPVLKEYNKHETQLRLEAFYTFNERFAKIRSKRIKKALKGITGNQSLHLMDDSAQEIEESRKRRISSPGEPGDSKSEALNAREHNPVGTKKSNKKQSRKREDVDATTPSRKKRNTGDSTSSELKILEPHILEDGQQCVSKGLGGKGKGRNISRGRAGGVQRGRGRRSAGFEPCQITSSDSDNDEDAWGLHVENLKGPQRMRRSMRSRKPVNYIMDDLEIGDTGDTNNSLDQSYKTCVNEEAREQELSSAKCVSVDAATGSGWKIKGIVEDLSLEEDLCGDNRESGGFCTPDDGEPGVSHFGNPSSGNESPTNFLKMGGGFCLDNSEFDDSHGGDSSPPTATGENNADHPHSSDLVDEADDNCKDLIIFRHKRTVNEPPDRGKTITLATEPNLDHLNHISNHDQSNTGVLLENANDDLGTTTGALSAMPFLRRKRKRNS